MKKKLTSVIAVILIMTIIMLSGCSPVKKAEGTVKNLLSAINNNNIEKAGKYIDMQTFLDGDQGNELNADFNKTLFSKLGYDIISSEETDEENITVTVKLTCADTVTAFSNAAAGYTTPDTEDEKTLTKEEIIKGINLLTIENINSEDAVSTEKEICLNVSKTDGKWVITNAAELSEAILGDSEHIRDSVVPTIGIFESLIAGDTTSLKQYKNSESVAPEESDDIENTFSDEFYKIIFSKLSYKINSVTKNEDGNIDIAVSVKNIDFSDITRKAFAEILKLSVGAIFTGQEPSDEEINNFMIEFYNKAINSEEAKYISTDIDLIFENTDGEMKLAANKTMENAITGGLFSALEELDNVFDNF